MAALTGLAVGPAWERSDHGSRQTTERRAVVQFVVLAVVILPLLPDEPFGPLGGIRLRSLWIVVLIFSGLNFAGYLARRWAGAERGYGMTGMLGGLISSTAVTLQFSRLSRQHAALATGLAVGVVGACTVLVPRVLIVSAILNARVAAAVMPLLGPVLIVGGVMTAAGLTRGPRQTATAPVPEARNPLRLWSSIRMTLAFQAALMAINWLESTLGEMGVLASAALLGLTDMDALTLSMNRLGDAPDTVALAARAIALGIVTNSVMKLTLALVLGGSAFRREAGVRLGVLTLVAAGTLWILW